MDKFIIADDPCAIGFHEHIVLNPRKLAEEQLQRRYLYSRSSEARGDPVAIKKIIEQNSSLRVAFGWSFESMHIYKEMMRECVEEITPRYNISVGNMMSDSRCDWLGFVPFNTFDKAAYENLSLYSLLIFNNELVEFQTDVVRFILQHKTFLQHSLMRNDDYRFDYFKVRRKDSIALGNAFSYYLECVAGTCGITTLPRRLVEEYIGCHYLRHSDLFFELLDFYKLKGNIYD
jgi:hypothetical protein